MRLNWCSTSPRTTPRLWWTDKHNIPACSLPQARLSTTCWCTASPKATHLLCVNASNQDHDFDHISSNNRFGAELENAGPRYSQLALQGPLALGILERLTQAPIASLRYYHFMFGEVDGVACLIARTGYTGEDGFELYFSPEHSEKLWNDLLDAGRGEGLLPCGLGARNTLRLEASMCLYGH